MTNTVTALLAMWAGLLWPMTFAGAQDTRFPQATLALAQQVCRLETLDRARLASIFTRHGLTIKRLDMTAMPQAGMAARIVLNDGGQLRLTLRFPGTQRAQSRLHIITKGLKADRFVQTGPDCAPAQARLVFKNKSGHPDHLLIYETGFQRPATREQFNPPVPAGLDPGGVAIALIDTGLNYTLPLLANRLARAKNGDLLGYDFADLDTRPYDFDPSRSALFPRRHGTAVASIIVAEAPKARLIPMRYPGSAHAKFADLINKIARGPARIAAMPLGGSRAGDWHHFLEAARAHKEILFIVSAGNNDRDIDKNPVYPAWSFLDNILVVTSTDRFGRLARGSNWGRKSVDIGVPAEQLDVIDHRGAKGRASGTSYAVPRVAALAARLKAAHQDWGALKLKQAIIKFAVPLRRGAGTPIKHGWIPNPALVDIP